MQICKQFDPSSLWIPCSYIRLVISLEVETPGLPGPGFPKTFCRLVITDANGSFLLFCSFFVHLVVSLLAFSEIAALQVTHICLFF